MPNEEIGKLNVVVNLDSTGFQNGISQLNRQLKLAQSEFQLATAKLGDFGKGTDKLKLQADSLTKQIEIQRQKVAVLEAAYQKSVEIKGADAKATQDLAIKLNKAQAELARMENELKKTNAELEKQSSSWYKVSQVATQAGEKFKSIGDKISGAGEKLIKAVTVPLAGAGAAAVKFALDFEDGMAKVATIADTSKVSLEEIREALLVLSNETGISVNELTEAEYQAISAGVDTAETMEFLDAAVKAAKGGFTDTASAVDALSTVLNAYGLSAKEAKRITDEMMVAQNYGKTTFGEMARSLGNVIPIAAALNVSTKELFASIAVLTKNGIQTSEAITGLKAALSNIMKPSSEASKLAKQLGIDFSAAHLQSVGWAKFLEEVREKTGGSAEKMAILFGSVEALNAVTVLAGKGAQDFSTALGMMEKAAGTTDKAFKQVTETSGAKLSKALNELRNSAIQIGDALAPAVEKVAGVLKTLAERFNSLTPEQQKVIIALAGIAAAIGPVVLVVGKLITAVGSISSAFGVLSGAMAAAGGASGAVGGALSALTGPIGIAIAAIAGLIAIFVYLFKNNEDFRKSTLNVWKAVKDFIKTISDEVKNIIKAFVDLIKVIWNKWGDEITAIVKFAFQIIKDVIKTVLDTIAGIIKVITKVIKGDWKGAWEELKNTASALWNGIKRTVLDLADGIAKGLGKIWDSIHNAAERAWNRLKDAAGDIFNRIKKSILDIFSGIHIPLPHLSVSVSRRDIAGVSIPVPDFDIRWYATGGIFNRPSIIGVGEAGPEAVIPIEKLTYIIRDALMQIQPQTAARPNEIHLHIGTLVADDYSLKQLERKLMNIRILENNRLGVMGT